MTRITRRQLKRNDLADSFGRTVDYVSHHRRGATEAIGAGVAVLLLAAGFFLFRGYRERSAGRELSEALSILEAPWPPIRPPRPPRARSRRRPIVSAKRRDISKRRQKGVDRGGSCGPGHRCREKRETGRGG